MNGNPSPSRLSWTEAGTQRSARWQSASLAPVPKRVRVVDDTLSGDTAYKLACEGSALLWRGDYHQARQMLTALAHRIDKTRARRKPGPVTGDPAQAFHQHRKTQAERARILGLLVLELGAQHHLALRRAPEAVPAAAQAAIGAQAEPYVVSLRELLGWIGAWEWRQTGVVLPQLDGARIHPHYGVYSPVRGEYLDLVSQAPLPAALAAQSLAFDIGTGTGVIAALLARRGVARVVATELQGSALVNAAETVAALGLAEQVVLEAADLFPAGAARAALIVCNPPWLPARPSSPIEAAVYDPDSRMLRGFLAGLRERLLPGGEGWLILSDLAEHLGLRSRAELEAWIGAAGLCVLGRLDTRPRHAKARDASDPLHAARSREQTSLWRLGAA